MKKEECKGNFENYKEQFRRILVYKYNWLVSKAHEYDSPELEIACKEGLSPWGAYYKSLKYEPEFKGSEKT